MQKKQHFWVHASSYAECAACGMRSHWEGAKSSCSGNYLTSEERKALVNRVVHKNDFQEIARIYSLGTDPMYRVTPPSSPYGRDGRKKTGLG